MSATQEYQRLLDLGRDELLNRAAALESKLATLRRQHSQAGLNLQDLEAARNEVLSALKGVQRKEIQERIDDRGEGRPT